MTMRRLLLTLAVAMATSCDVIGGTQPPIPHEALRYRVTENVRVGTTVGDLVSDSGLRRQHSYSVLRLLRFSLLTRPSLPLDIGHSDG